LIKIKIKMEINKVEKKKNLTEALIWVKMIG
jgi:hypothetical protein